MKTIIMSALIALAAIGVVLYMFNVAKKSEKFNPAPEFETDEGEYLAFGKAYKPFPDGELKINPIYTRPKFFGPPNPMTGIPEGRFQKGGIHAEFDPSFMWCHSCFNDNMIYIFNAGEIVKGTSNARFISMNPEFYDVKNKAAYLKINEDGTLSVRYADRANDTVSPEETVTVKDSKKKLVKVGSIALSADGELEVTDNQGLPIQLCVSLQPGQRGKVSQMMPLVPSNVNNRRPYAMLNDDCSFSVFDGSGQFHYQASF